MLVLLVWGKGIGTCLSFEKLFICFTVLGVYECFVFMHPTCNLVPMEVRRGHLDFLGLELQVILSRHVNASN